MNSSTWYVMGPIPVPMEDPIIHTQASPWCSDGSCPCHGDLEGRELREIELWQPYQNGLATWVETVWRFYGKQGERS